MALTWGTKLGAYEIQSPLDAGGMGEVYCATDTKLGCDVALKVLPSGAMEFLRPKRDGSCEPHALVTTCAGESFGTDCSRLRAATGRANGMGLSLL